MVVVPFGSPAKTGTRWFQLTPQHPQGPRIRATFPCLCYSRRTHVPRLLSLCLFRGLIINRYRPKETTVLGGLFKKRHPHQHPDPNRYFFQCPKRYLERAGKFTFLAERTANLFRGLLPGGWRDLKIRRFRTIRRRTACSMWSKLQSVKVPGYFFLMGK